MLAACEGSTLRLELASLGTAKVGNCREIIFRSEVSTEFCSPVSHPTSKGDSVVIYFISGARAVHQWNSWLPE